ncbi:MAG: hypothetical protein DMG30_01410 [Acidobacteria bacterium]|nr:MAG: hypothetical protein DMG30_01410 [Acidobacteriota bacterium]
MGEVYRARDARLDRIVAIKILSDHIGDHAGLRERFELEARTIASLNHSHICTLHDVGRLAQNSSGFLNLFMKFSSACFCFFMPCFLRRAAGTAFLFLRFTPVNVASFFHSNLNRLRRGGCTKSFTACLYCLSPPLRFALVRTEFPHRWLGIFVTQISL